jgi:hypothetical protein
MRIEQLKPVVRQFCRCKNSYCRSRDCTILKATGYLKGYFVRVEQVWFCPECRKRQFKVFNLHISDYNAFKKNYKQIKEPA